MNSGIKEIYQDLLQIIKTCPFGDQCKAEYANEDAVQLKITVTSDGPFKNTAVPFFLDYMACFPPIKRCNHGDFRSGKKKSNTC